MGNRTAAIKQDLEFDPKLGMKCFVRFGYVMSSVHFTAVLHALVEVIYPIFKLSKEDHYDSEDLLPVIMTMYVILTIALIVQSMLSHFLLKLGFTTKKVTTLRIWMVHAFINFLLALIGVIMNCVLVTWKRKFIFFTPMIVYEIYLLSCVLILHRYRKWVNKRCNVSQNLLMTARNSASSSGPASAPIPVTPTPQHNGSQHVFHGHDHGASSV